MTRASAKAGSSEVLRRKLAAIATLTAHEGTGDADLAAAQLARTRLTAALAEAPAGEAWSAGAEFRPGECPSTAQLAGFIRAEINLARQLARLAACPGSVTAADPVAAAPPVVTIEVSVPCPAAITISVRGIPRSWGYQPAGDRQGGACDAPSPALLALARALNAIGNAYSRDPDPRAAGRRYRLRVDDGAGNQI